MAVTQKKEGLYIVFEGPDGGGKGTQARRLNDNLQRLGIDFLMVREPGGTEVAEEIRRILLRSRSQGDLASKRCEFLLFSAARADLIPKLIKPAIEKGKIVIAERCRISSGIYQAALGIDTAPIEYISDFVTENLMPDGVFLLDVPVEITMERKGKKIDADVIEKRDVEYHQRVRDGYLQYAAENSTFVQTFDGCLSEEVLDDAILGSTLALIKNKNNLT